MDIERLKEDLDRLKRQHKESEDKLLSLIRETVPNHQEIRTLKKSKLEIKDQIENLKKKLVPDIIA